MSIRDNQESTGLFEPLMISERSKNQEKLSDMVLELATRSEGFRRSLPPPPTSRTTRNLCKSGEKLLFPF